MSQLLVALNGIEVGTLEKARSGAMTFQYLKEWVNRPGAFREPKPPDCRTL